jgi:hypothetical protein
VVATVVERDEREHLARGQVMSRTREWVTTSPSASAVSGEKSISS